MTAERLRNFVNGKWRESEAAEAAEVTNPATAEVMALTPLSTAAEVDEAARLALDAFGAWRRTPAPARIQHLFALKALLEEHFEDLARTIVMENGKTFEDAAGEMRRAIENVEVACGIPMLMLGDFSEDVARGVDEYMIRQPVGVAAIICPFNFPGMIPFWYLPYALACGNTVIVKPSERCPVTMQKVFRLLEQVNLPAGVANLVNGGADTVNALLDHPAISAVTFVGSTPVAAPHLQPGRGERETGAGTGRRKEPADHPARRRSRADHEHCGGQRVRQCRPTMPGCCACHHCGGRRKNLRAHPCGSSAGARGRVRPRGGRPDGAGHHGQEPRPDCWPGGEGARGRRPAVGGRPRSDHSRLRERLFHAADSPQRRAAKQHAGVD